MKKNQGFTLIELMIVIAIIAIIAAIAIPNLMQSRVRANEATAISAVKQICTSQVTYQVGKQGRGRGWVGGNNGYCDNYRNLAFAIPVGSTAGAKLALVSDVVANASLTADGGGTAVTVAGAPGLVAAGLEAYQGYLFSSDPDPVWTVDYACYAVPNVPGTTGSNAYWAGQQGTVYLKGLPTATAAPTAYTTGQTPQTIPTPADWSAM